LTHKLTYINTKHYFGLKSRALVVWSRAGTIACSAFFCIFRFIGYDFGSAILHAMMPRIEIILSRGGWFFCFFLSIHFPWYIFFSTRSWHFCPLAIDYATATYSDLDWPLRHCAMAQGAPSTNTDAVFEK